MAIVTLRICDLCDPEAMEPGEPAPFMFAGRDYNVDLCQVHRGQRDDQVMMFISRARRLRRPVRL